MGMRPRRKPAASTSRIADRGSCAHPVTEAIQCEPWLRHLSRHVATAPAGVDPEGPHQMRVAIARLSVWLRLGGDHPLDRELRWLRDRLASVRDCDVQLESGLPERVAAALRRERARAQRVLVRALDSPRVAHLLEAIARLAPVPRRRARKHVARLARRTLRRARAARGHWDDVDELHRLRCAVRRLRHALEWLGDDSSELVRLQDALGIACDRGVALRRNASGEYRRRLTRELQDAARDAHASWRAIRPSVKRCAVKHGARSAVSRPREKPPQAPSPACSPGQ